MHLEFKLISKLLNQLPQTEQGKPILNLIEHEIWHLITDDKIIRDDEEKIYEQLKEFKIKISQLHNGIEISVKGYVGSIEFKNFILKVGPKFTKLENLGQMLDFINDLEMNKFDDKIRFNSQLEQPLEIVINSFVKACGKLIGQRLHYSYELHNKNILFLKGKLLLQNQIQNDFKLNMKFNCKYNEFTSNNLENQIILYVLKKCKNLTKFSEQKIRIKKLIHQMDSQITTKDITISDFRKIQYTRLNNKYKNPHDLAKLIIQNIGIKNLRHQKTPTIVPFFIDMSKLFEKFLENLFKNYYSNGFTVKPQERHSAWCKDGVPKDMDIIPDILVYRGNNVSSIIDAKYMDEIERSVKYQIAFYLNFLNKSIGYVILPYEKHNDYKLTVIGKNITINVKHINIDEILNIIYSKEKSKKEICEEIQNRLLDLVPIPK